ncbi:hypothetical protein A2276_00370 [candidate division WOR-1 bacterium RIFOXYA12_FULL_43_27]|uniref:SoxR reducing system RseC family protein n=1 Tax=candidate division WOR-1 bacterium RIFOXYC2_FULL_46_14 TaxID=1802587 RepID=A0A1F4U4S6_UNCSA|nr:MAG: hypothetical protein A2276_00370 [candidate division WOR-1 bacterium RIFOXYA12_FULL_43_27]OGC20849.1 MAG: hypothetical protein A2292_07505 [candidate division WOR-1 bacterium RIFOXYB2_FULL_46_45]OGC31414.1 MAG: hypothetical protein A2232_03945 [candidate division WOR-1 bacterium RIFOXYA2_FULL_46_56]OGC39820.1 MAG: hypothetical protein A2438_04780 [candidate division WOR-1 bacterium RIFOXYC2_FULL_46_14]
MSDCSGCKGCGKPLRGEFPKGEVKPQAVLFANFLVFILPIIGLFCGYFIFGIPGAALGVILALAIVKIYDMNKGRR